MAKMACVILVVVGLPCVAGCASSGGSGDGPASLSLTGDERGGKIPHSVGEGSSQSSAYEMITAHCAKFGKKGFITRMDFDGGTMSFECRLQKAKPGT